MDTNALRILLGTVASGTLLAVTFPKGKGRQQEISSDVVQGPLTSFKHLFLRGMLTMEQPMAALVLEGVIDSSQWENDENRTFLVRTTDTFDPNRFVTHVGETVESVEVR